MKVCEGDTERVLQLERTRRGVCARCGEAVAAHVDGDCADGGGSYTWAQTGSEMAAMIAQLEAVLAAAKGS